jgi:hypothetical protein|tara:strand:+ start:679 stop:894 length:216 start_codon:yes stop_codon:yes gene_type:complete
MNNKKASNEQSREIASDEQNNILGSFIQSKDKGFDCYMWWPQGRKLVEVQKMIFRKKNAKFLEVNYVASHG